MTRRTTWLRSHSLSSSPACVGSRSRPQAICVISKDGGPEGKGSESDRLFPDPGPRCRGPRALTQFECILMTLSLHWGHCWCPAHCVSIDRLSSSAVKVQQRRQPHFSSLKKRNTPFSRRRSDLANGCSLGVGKRRLYAAVTTMPKSTFKMPPNDTSIPTY
jgi:hypothetical protein